MVKTLTKIMNAMHSDRYVKVVRSLKMGALEDALEKCYYGELKAFDSALYDRKRDYGTTRELELLQDAVEHEYERRNKAYLALLEKEHPEKVDEYIDVMYHLEDDIII